MSEYLVDIQHERLSFFTPAGEVKALNDVSIHLNDGEVLGIVGESGSGESDLRQILESPFLARRQYSGTMKEALGSLEYFGIKEEDLNIVATFDSAEMLRDCVEAGMGMQTIHNCYEEPDRKKAVKLAIELAEPGDILVLAGKGHEKMQEISGCYYPMEDAELIREAIEEKG